jgi:flagellar biosynthetic protein FliR
MTLTEQELGAIIATFARAGALAMAAPVIGDAGVPVRVRLLFVVAIALGVGANRPGVPFGSLPAVIPLEIGMGILTGATAKFILARVGTAGQLMGLSLGLGFASQYDVNAGESAGTIRQILVALAGLAFLMTGGLEAIVRSSAEPANSSFALLGPDLIRAATSSFGHGLALAGPVVLACLVGNLGLAVMNRAAPAINVFSISLAAVLILGGIVLIATSNSLIGGILHTAREAVASLAHR